MLKDGDTGVGNTNSLDLALGEDSLHLFPSLGLVPVPVDVSRSVFLDREKFVSSVLNRSAGTSVLVSAESAATRGKNVHRPVDEIKVEVVCTERLEGSVETPFNVVVERRPAGC